MGRSFYNVTSPFRTFVHEFGHYGLRLGDEYEQTVYDWGEVYQNKKVIHIFKFKNTGKADLVIDQVKSG